MNSTPVQIVVGLFCVIAALAIAAYATWLLTQRLKTGASRRQSFGEWLRNIFDAVWGL